MASNEEHKSYDFNKIVVATDFSDSAASAARWAVELARARDAHLTLVHAVHLPASRPDYVAPSADFGGELQEAARGRLEEEAEALAGDGFEIHTRLLVGPPVRSILEVARQLVADLVVVGTRGLSGLTHLLLGSTAERIVQHAHCPVLTTHGKVEPQPGGPRTILVPSDFSGDAEQAALAARELLRTQSDASRLVLFHAYHLPVEYSAYGTVPIAPTFLEESRMKAEADLEELAATLREDGLEVEIAARAGYPVEAILDEAAERDVDLIAMGTQGRSGAAHLLLGSVAERVVQRAPCPVLTLRKPKEQA